MRSSWISRSWWAQQQACQGCLLFLFSPHQSHRPYPALSDHRHAHQSGLKRPIPSTKILKTKTRHFLKLFYLSEEVSRHKKILSSEATQTKLPELFCKHHNKKKNRVKDATKYCSNKPRYLKCPALKFCSILTTKNQTWQKVGVFPAPALVTTERRDSSSTRKTGNLTLYFH